MSARKKSYSGFGMGFLRPFAAVVVLTAFILVITFAVRGLSQLSTETVLIRTKPLLAKLNIDLENNKVVQVVEKFATRLSDKNLTGNDTDKNSEETLASQPTVEVDKNEQPQVAGAATTNKNTRIKLAILADVHSDYTNLKKALDKTKAMGISKIFFLGDYTKLGLIEDLTAAKKIMDSYDIDYYSLAGDHDLWKSVGYENFFEVFGAKKQTVTIEGVKFVFLDNGANYTVVDSENIEWFKKEVTDADFVVLSQPLYYPKLNKYMGKVNGEDVTELMTQRNMLLDIIRGTDVKAVIAADLHISDSVSDPVKPKLNHVLVGALTGERNLQSPRFSVFKYFDDSSYELEDVVLE
ncbi:metallophosphoesterase [candidate division WWE3 bacterium]|uniref:Metallophosphoesterase n=1 Tax=candidate division WWE3 bacterium TaxID=2053526 RepID=A0A7X9DKI3_UNCKA|nr:metallophosphoesterase [candidate division WWE3 bacterium]